jgi:serine/threonine protein kinase
MSNQIRELKDSKGTDPALDRRSTAPSDGDLETDNAQKDRQPASIAAADRAAGSGTAQDPTAGGQSKVLHDRYEPTRRVNIGCGDQVVRALDRNKLKFEDSNPFTTLIFVPKPLADNGGLLAPILASIRQWQTLGHPHIVQTLEFIQGEERSFLTAEHLQGCSLDRRTADSFEAPLTTAERLRIINNIGSALNYAHGHELVHGKLSPGAIWLIPSGPSKLLDPGVCTLLEANMASEQTAGHRAHPANAYRSAEASASGQNTQDRRMDVFALACISYELLTGQHPFDGLNAFEARTRNASIRHLAPLTPRQWNAFKHALEFQASARTSTVQAFLDELNGPEHGGWIPAAAATAGLTALLLGGWNYFDDPSPPARVATVARLKKPTTVKPAPKPAPREDVYTDDQDDEPFDTDDFDPPDLATDPASQVQGAGSSMDDKALGEGSEGSQSPWIINQLLERGNIQLAAGQFTEPPGSAAIDTFQEIIRRAPNSEEAKPGLRTLGAYLLAEAQKALLAKDLESAQIALHRAQSIDPTAAGLVEALQQLAALRQSGALAQDSAGGE